MIDLTEQECRYVLELLSNAHRDMLHELHHAVSRKFEEDLKQRVALNEQLAQRLSEQKRRDGVGPQPIGARG